MATTSVWTDSQKNCKQIHTFRNFFVWTQKIHSFYIDFGLILKKYIVHQKFTQKRTNYFLGLNFLGHSVRRQKIFMGLG